MDISSRTCPGRRPTSSRREAFGPAADAHRLVRIANEGDATALELLTEIGRKLGSGLGSIVNAYDPELIVSVVGLPRPASCCWSRRARSWSAKP